MKTETIMKKLQDADVALATIQYVEHYDFYIDISNHTKQVGHYSAMYYDRCEQEGLTIEEAKEKLGEYLRSNFTIVVPKEQEDE